MAFQLAPSVNWDKLRKVLPLGRSREQRDLRQQLFKDLVVRGMVPKTDDTFKVCTKADRYRVRGTLSLFECESVFQGMLVRAGAAEPGPELHLAISRAFQAARSWIEPVTAFDETYMDMNQFQGFLLHLVHDVDLRSCMASAGLGQNASSVCVSLEDFQRFLDMIASPSSTPRLQCDWSNTREFALWRGSSAAAFSELCRTSLCMSGLGLELPYEKLIERCLQHVVADAVMTSELLPENRKAAFQLIQALQNVESLPNCVPGPFSADLESSRAAVTNSSRSSVVSPGFSDGLMNGEQVGGPLAWRSAYMLSNEMAEANLNSPRKRPQYAVLGALELVPPPTNRGREESSLTIQAAADRVAERERHERKADFTAEQHASEARRSARLAAAGGAACRKEIVTSVGAGLNSARGPLKLIPGRILYK